MRTAVPVPDVMARLRQVPGVYGSFLVDRWGGVAYRDVPGVVSTRDLERAGATLWRLWYCLDVAFADEVVLELPSHRLFALRLWDGSLCVFAGARTDTSALRDACRGVRAALLA